MGSYNVSVIICFWGKDFLRFCFYSFYCPIRKLFDFYLSLKTIEVFWDSYIDTCFRNGGPNRIATLYVSCDGVRDVVNLYLCFLYHGL